jgi:hypothetical protein
MAKLWTKGRGKLGVFAPLFGAWIAEAESAMGHVSCRRTLQPVLGGSYVQLTAHWHYGASQDQRIYEELALIGVGDGGVVSFWSFTSDGKRSVGRLADVSDIHPEAIGFESQMPAGLARQVYWPAEDGGFYWAVEARSKKGWNRFVEHLYQVAQASECA